MKGFVKNEGERPVFTLQRAVNPGFSITFDEAYQVVGKKSGKKRGPAFVNWLRENHFQNPIWTFYKDEGEAYFEGEPLRSPAAIRPGQGAGKPQVRRDESQEKGNLAALQMINSELAVAKQLIDNCRDRVVLRKALAASKLYAGKEAYMRYLIRRLEQVYF